jgi:hypothetical protein
MIIACRVLVAKSERRYLYAGARIILKLSLKI